jgi:ribonuclease VapC
MSGSRRSGPKQRVADLYVLDTSAVLAVINGEPGEAIVRSLILDSFIGTVTLAEIHTKFAEWQLNGEPILETLTFGVRDIMPFTKQHAILCGQLRSSTRTAGLSLGDRACIALAASLDAEVVTSDRAWAQLHLPCSVRLFR